MKTRKNRILSSVCLAFTALMIIFSINAAYAANQIDARKNNTDAWINSDEWVLLWDYSLYNNTTADVDGNIVTPNLTVLKTITWNVTSKLYWSFNIISLNALYNSAKFNSYTSDCPTWWALMLDWTISSDVWWVFSVDSNSHICIEWWKISMKFKSAKIWEKDLWSAGTALTTTVSQAIKVTWISKVVTQSINNNNNAVMTVAWNYQDQKYLTKTNVNKQIEEIIRWKTPDSWTTKIWKTDFENNTWSLKYFNYEWQSEIVASNEGNKGKILTLENNYSFYDTAINYKLKVSWEKLIIVKWGNVYINADIYNENDTNSLLVIIAKRWFWANYKDWWNIYIDPSVTNIDAVLIADWSILNYDKDLKVAINSWVDKNKVRRQLMIYWQVTSNNTIASDIVPYWSDKYIIDWKWWPTSSMYDISKLRTFELIPVPAWQVHCATKQAPRRDGTMDWLQYAWAWKKKCEGWNDDKEPWLRESLIENPVIVLYNANIQVINPFILQNN
jgi:hypothetical protein